ncbi:unnamed protein product, partial [Rotaria sp. Silwood1]
MIAIGGIIGPGLLVGSGTALAYAGPAGALIAFAATGLIVFFVMQSLGYFVLAVLIDIGVIGGTYIGTQYWRNPGSFADGINGIAKVFVIAGTLYAGVEMVGVTAGECRCPEQAVPRAIKQVFLRIIVFYLGLVFFIGLLIPYNSTHLLSASSKAAASPLTISLEDAGIHIAAHIINGLIVLSVLSAGISSIYVTSRTMFYLGKTGRAPKFLGITNKHGVPWPAILFCN